MTVEEIFKELSERAIKGVMFHDNMTDYYDFLNLHGYKKMSEYHARSEMKGLRSLHTYYLNHYNKLVLDSQFDSLDVIPKSWYDHTRLDVDINTKRQAVKESFAKWVEWERGTKALYSQMYKELCDLGEVASAMKIAEFVKDVDHELKWVERKQIELQSADYAMDFIIDEQQYYFEFYKKKENEK